MKPTEKQFAACCFLVLMNHHGQGIHEAHPSYVEEKLHMFNMGYGAYGMLDYSNQTALQMYLAKWGYELPDEVN